MFADNMLMFCRGDVVSVSLLFSAFMRFSRASGLEDNSERAASTCVVCLQILGILKFKKYAGLISGQDLQNNLRRQLYLGSSYAFLRLQGGGS